MDPTILYYFVCGRIHGCSCQRLSVPRVSRSIISVNDLAVLKSDKYTKILVKGTERKAGTKENEENVLAVAAFDFGSPFTSFAFSFISHPRSIRIRRDWGCNIGFASCNKTPTCILLKPDGKYEFGNEAQEAFSILEGDELNEVEFYEGFQMHLYNVKSASRTTKVTAHNGRTTTLLKLVAITFKCMKDQMIQMAENQLGIALSETQIRWVVTVPAIWDDSAKQLMREAASQAGLMDGRDPSKFLLALDPESVAVYCKDSDINDSLKKLHPELEFSEGFKFLVVDIGGEYNAHLPIIKSDLLEEDTFNFEGRTLDMTALCVISDVEMKVMSTEHVGNLGGSRVDSNILDLLREIFGKDVFDNFMKENAQAFSEMMIKFEVKKRCISFTKDTPINISICQEFAKTCMKVLGTQPAESVSDEMKAKGVKVRRSVLSLPHLLVLKAFTEVTKPIMAEVEDLLKRCEVDGVTHIIMVGGFSDCKIIQDQMKQRFSPEYTILTLDEPSSVALKGAVLCGHNADTIKARRATKTFLVELWPLFVEGKHPESRKVRSSDGQFLVKGGLHTLVSRGEIIHKDKTRCVVVTPLYCGQRSIPIKLFRSERVMVDYADEAGVEHVATFNYELSRSWIDRQVLLKFQLGARELGVTTVDMHGEEVTVMTGIYLQ